MQYEINLVPFGSDHAYPGQKRGLGIKQAQREMNKRSITVGGAVWLAAEKCQADDEKQATLL